MNKHVIEAVSARFGDAILHQHEFRGDATVIIGRDRVVEVFAFLKEDPAMAFNMPIDVCGVDYLTYENDRPHGERFEVVYHLYSTTKGHRLRVRVPVPEDDPVSPTATGIWRGTNWFERETHDMFGIRFSDHPDMRRVLMYEEFEGHPLRKDYPVRGYQPRLEMPRVQGDPLPWRKPVDEEA